jgi:hypothetical protein
MWTFITKDDIFDRLRGYRPDVGCSFCLRRGRNGFAHVGMTIKRQGFNVNMFFFDVYAGNRPLYLHIKGLIEEVVVGIFNSQLIFDEWSEDEAGTSNEITGVAAAGCGCADSDTIEAGCQGDVDGSKETGLSGVSSDVGQL